MGLNTLPVIRNVFRVLVILAVIFSSSPGYTVEQRVVVIPLNTKGGAAAAKELYIPATAFRPLLSMTAWEYQAEGGMIDPAMAS